MGGQERDKGVLFAAIFTPGRAEKGPRRPWQQGRGVAGRSRAARQQAGGEVGVGSSWGGPITLTARKSDAGPSSGGQLAVCFAMGPFKQSDNQATSFAVVPEEAAGQRRLQEQLWRHGPQGLCQRRAKTHLGD